MSKLKKLIEIADERFREEIGHLYVVPESRIDNILSVLEGSISRAEQMQKIIVEQQSEIVRLTKMLEGLESRNG